MRRSIISNLFFLSSAALVFTGCTPSQDDAISPVEQFVKFYGRNGLDVGRDIKFTPSDGGMIVLGQRNSIGAVDNSILLFKMDSAGNLTAQESEIGANDGFLYTAQKVVVDPRGGYIIAGTRTNINLESYMFTLRVGDDLSPDASWGTGGFALYGSDSIAFNFNGSTISRIPNHRLFDLAVDEDGFAIAGLTNDIETNKFNFNPATDVSDVSVFLLDGQGNVRLSQIYGYVGRDEGQGIIPIGNGEYAIMGITNRSAFGSNDTQLSGSNFLFNIIDSEGQILQNKIYGSISSGGDVDVDDVPVVMIRDGLGYTAMANDEASNAIMIKLTSTGELVALSNLDLSQGSISTSVIRTFRGEYVITGSVNTRTNTETSVDRGTDMLVMNVDQNFTVNTNRVYNYGGEENDVSNGIIQLPSSNLVILGTTDFENGNTMITLMRTNTTGRLISN